LGIKFNMTPTTFDALIPGVLAKRFDFAMAEANITPERRKQVDFVSYLNNGLAILVPKDSDIKSTKLSDLCGLSVGTNRGASPIPLLEAASKECEANGKQAITVKTYNQIAEAILAVKSGRIPVAIGDQQPISYAAKQNATLRLAVGQGFNQTQAGIIFPKGSPMEKPVADALNNLIANGTYQKILDKWGVGSSAVDKAEILPAN
jgi:polar amino acid transport system substrate-binding protein